MANDPGDLGVVIDLREDSFADLRVLFHPTSFLERQSTGLLKQSRRKPHLADVVDEPAQVSELLLLLRQPETNRDVTRVDRDGR